MNIFGLLLLTPLIWFLLVCVIVWVTPKRILEPEATKELIVIASFCVILAIWGTILLTIGLKV